MSIRLSTVEFGEMNAARALQSNPMMMRGWRGQVIGYNPSNHTVQVEYFHASDQPTRTQWMSLVVPSAVAGHGEGWGVENGAQVLVLELDPAGDDVVAIGFTYNEVDKALGIPPSERWIVDKRGSSIKLTADGPEDGDGQGAVKVTAQAYASTQTDGGLSHVLSDVDDTIVAQTPSGVQHILDDAAQEISSVGPQVSLGARFADLSADQAAIAKVDLSTLGNTIDLNRLADQLLNAQQMVAAGIPNAADLLAFWEAAIVQTIGATAIPDGSSTVRLKG
jgi:hypothetical protein